MKRMLWLWFILAAAVVAVAGVFMVRDQAHDRLRPVSKDEAISAAETLLVKKLSGPRYFNATADEPDQEGGPWIDVADAWAQLPRIATARKLDSEAKELVGRLIDGMAESHPHRMVGGKRFNLPRLNLSLDGSKK